MAYTNQMVQGQAGRGQFMRPVQSTGYPQAAGGAASRMGPPQQEGMNGLVSGMRNTGFAGGFGSPPVAQKPWLPTQYGENSRWSDDMANEIAGGAAANMGWGGPQRGNEAWMGAANGVGAASAGPDAGSIKRWREQGQSYNGPSMPSGDPQRNGLQNADGGHMGSVNMAPGGEQGGFGSMQPDMVQANPPSAPQNVPQVSARQQRRNDWLVKQGRGNEVGGYNAQGAQGGALKRQGGARGTRGTLTKSPLSTSRQNARKR